MRTFENDFTEWPNGFFKDAKISITKNFLAADGSEKATDEVFYAGIFADEEYTTLFDKVETNIVKLEMNGASSTTVEMAVSYDENNPYTLYITEVDKNGTPVSTIDDFGYAVTVEITPTPTEEITPTPTAETTPTVTPTETTSPKTGDDTPTGAYALLLMAAAAVIGAVTYKRRRRG